MLKKNINNYYLFSISNFMAALGGGMILGKGMNAINIPELQGGSLLAFFVGTLWGLGLLQVLPKKISTIFAPWFSICGGLISLVLLSFFLHYSTNEKISGSIGMIFFLLLSIRFGFWFYSRVLRVSAAAGHQQRIAWVELGYYSGIILGLILWVFLGINLGFVAALFFDALLQLIAGLIDLIVHSRQSSNKKNDSQSDAQVIPIKLTNNILRDQKIWGWRLAIAVMLLTLGIQVIIFNLAHRVTEGFSPYVLAIFYLGAAISTLFFKKLNIELEWILSKKSRGYAIIAFGNPNNKKQISFLLGSLLPGVCIAIVIIGVLQWNWGVINSSLGFNEYCLLAFVFISTFFYGILELAILDRIGLEEQKSTRSGMIIKTYGLMSIAAAIGLWMLQVTQSSFIGLNLTFAICFLLTVLSIRKRKLIEVI